MFLCEYILNVFCYYVTYLDYLIVSGIRTRLKLLLSVQHPLIRDQRDSLTRLLQKTTHQFSTNFISAIFVLFCFIIV